MARKTKKNEAPKVNIGAEIFASLRDLEKLNARIQKEIDDIKNIVLKK